MITEGLRLADEAYLDRLLQTGLDHLLIVFEPDNAQPTGGRQTHLVADLFVAIHLTLTRITSCRAPALERVALGARQVSLSTALQPGAGFQTARDRAGFPRLELVWNLPVPYSAINPVALETEQGAQPEAARARLALRSSQTGMCCPRKGSTRCLAIC